MKKSHILFVFILCISSRVSSQNGFTTYTNPIYSSNLRTSIKIDSGGNIWYGTTGTPISAKGAHKFDGINWTVYNTTNSGIASNIVNDVAFDGSGNVWFATSAGLSKFDGALWTTYNSINSGVPNDTVNCLFCEGSNIWVGTRQGLAKYNGSSWVTFNISNSGLIDNFITSLYVNNAGDKFIGTNKGLSINRASGWFNYNESNSNLVSNTITSIYEENSTTMWFGTNNFGAFKFTNNNFIPYSSLINDTNAPYSYNIGNICKGPQGGVLFSSANPYYGSGIPPGFIEIVGSAIYVYPYETGYSSNFQVLDPSDNKIWFIRKNGSGPSNTICSFDLQLFTGIVTAQNTGYVGLDINQVKADLLAGGDMHWNLENAGYEVPKQSGRHAIFTSALWIGGLDAGSNLHQAAMTYRQTGNDYWPGPLDTITGTTDSATSFDYDKIWKLDRWQINEFRTMFANGSVTAGTYIPAQNILSWPAHGAGAYSRNMAPFVDVDGDGFYDPLNDGDYPKIKGDQMCYWIFNDNLKLHTETGGQAFRVEIHASAYAYACDTISDSLKALNYSTFYDYEIYNRSAFSYHDVYLGLWRDGDLGGYMDDYVGCNPSGNYTFQYNSDDDDESLNGVLGYGNNPPMISNVILDGPLAPSSDGIDNDNDGTTDENGEKNLMTNVLNYNNNSNPINGNPGVAQDFYNYMRNNWRDGSPVVYGGDGTGPGTPAKFMYDGVPGLPGWSEATLQNPFVDRRILMNCGPFNMNAGEHVNFNMAVVWTRDDKSTYDFLSLYNRNKSDIEKIQQWYANDNFPSCEQAITAGIAEDKEVANELHLYPNPSNDVIYIDYQTLSKEVTVEIYDIRGQLLKTIKVNSQSTQAISVAELSSGLYLLKLNDGKNTKVQRFVKQ